jgi:hypothetical protein
MGSLRWPTSQPASARDSSTKIGSFFDMIARGLVRVLGAGKCGRRLAIAEGRRVAIAEA